MNICSTCIFFDATVACAYKFTNQCAENYREISEQAKVPETVKNVNIHASALGKLGGKSKSVFKQASSALNLNKARALRWPKKGGL